MREARSRTAAPSHQNELAEVVQTPWVPFFRGFEKEQCRTRTHLRGYITSLACKPLRISKKELENVTGEMDVHVSLLEVFFP